MTLKVAMTSADVRMEAEGVWLDYKDGARLKIARAGNPEFSRESDRQRAPFKKQLKRDSLSARQQKKILCAIYAKTVLLDWKGIGGMDGEAVKYTPEVGEQALFHDFDLREFVLEQSENESLFRDERLESTGKKSKAG